jgi:hypothetical protein
MLSKFYRLDVILIMAAGLLSGCSQNTAPQNDLPLSGNHVSVRATPPKPTSTPVSDARRILRVFLPGKDGKLHRTTFEEPSDTAASDTEWDERPFRLLFSKAPQFFPANTRLTDRITKNKEYPDPTIGVVFEVRLNREFLTSPLWKDEKKAKLAFDAIAMTATQTVEDGFHPTYPISILVLVDGKPITKLGRTKVKNPA